TLFPRRGSLRHKKISGQIPEIQMAIRRNNLTHNTSYMNRLRNDLDNKLCIITIDLLAPRRQERQVRKRFSLRPLRLCARYSDFWLWPGHARFFAVTYSP